MPLSRCSYGAEQGQGALREAVAGTFYSGLRTADEIFISDGSKCDIARIQMMFGNKPTVAVQVRRGFGAMLWRGDRASCYRPVKVAREARVSPSCLLNDLYIHRRESAPRALALCDAALTLGLLIPVIGTHATSFMPLVPQDPSYPMYVPAIHTAIATH